MGGKMNDATLLSEPTDNTTAQQIKSNKKKRNKKNKHKEIEIEEEEQQQNELNLKRKLGAEKKKNKKGKKEKKKQEKELEEIGISEQSHDDDDGGHKKKQKEKEKKKNTEDRDKANGKESENGDGETISFFKQKDDGQVVVTGKEVKEAQYKALKWFTESKLPDDILGCWKNFKNPSPILSHAWPFLLDGHDFIGIAKTGSGNLVV